MPGLGSAGGSEGSALVLFLWIGGAGLVLLGGFRLESGFVEGILGHIWSWSMGLEFGFG